MNWLRENLDKTFHLPPLAVDWLLSVWETIQVFDDVADGDEVKREDLDAVIWHTLVGFHQNPFFVAHAQKLVPLMASMVLKWKASDTMEREGKADARSFVWRAGYYDLVLMCVALVHGPDKAMKSAHGVLQLYGEAFEDYMKEFGHA